ncbi:MAG: AAA family ATPase, partial [Clostridia bacterium]|nr:AAA family ATPase [Clostridia bacterium]
ADTARLILEAETRQGIVYAKKQREAIFDAMTHGVTLLTGGPGTGKTTVINGLCTIFESLHFTVSLAAPTGRAAKKMSEATGREAKTIHRLLEIELSDDENLARFYRGEKNPLESDVIIVDEASMVDVLLMESLLRAARKRTRLILIGDVHQLPSVGAGNLLSDLIASRLFRTVFLTEIFRQKENSGIVWNSHEIVEGRYPDLSAKMDDFYFIRRESPEAIVKTVVDLIQNRLPGVYGKDVSASIQVITPSHKGEPGTLQLNRTLQETLNPPSKEKKEKLLRTRIFRQGDRVMQVKNNYSLTWENGQSEGVGIFNGDIGTVEEVDDELERLVLRFDDRTVNYDYSYLDQLELAYAITVHKSQGSEYPIVILPVFACPPMLQTRNLIYTALTRASRMVILVGRTDIFFHMIDNDRQIRRFTALPTYLKELQ